MLKSDQELKNFEEFLLKSEYKLNRGDVIQQLLGIKKKKWAIAMIALIIGENNKIITKAYIMEKLSYLKKEDEKDLISFLAWPRNKIYHNLKKCYEVK